MSAERVQNKDILERLNSIEEINTHKISQLERRQAANDKLLRGNGEPGLKGQVDANTKALQKIEKYFMAIVTALSISLIMQLWDVLKLVGG